MKKSNVLSLFCSGITSIKIRMFKNRWMLWPFLFGAIAAPSYLFFVLLPLLTGAHYGQPVVIVAEPFAGAMTWLLRNMPSSLVFAGCIAALSGGIVAGVLGALTAFALHKFK